MNKTLITLTAAFSALAAFADGFVWPSSGTVTVPSGETYVATEADMANVNGLDKIAFADATAKVTFTGATAPKIPFEGLGTIEKDSTNEWTLTGAAGDGFKGTYLVTAGTVTPNVGAAFGNNVSTNESVTLKIASGATLRLANGMNGNIQLKHTKIRIAGNGANAKGAILVQTSADTNTDDIKHIALDDDASIYADGSSMYYYHSGTLDLNEKNLTITGSGPYYMQDVTVTGGGAFIYPDTVTSRTFCLRGAVDFVPQPDGTLTKVVMNGKQYIHYYQGKWEPVEDMPPQRYELDVNGPEVTVQHNHQFVHVSPGEYKDHAVELAGPVKFKDATSSLRLYVSTSPGSSCSNCMLKVSGQISGPGSVITHQYDGHTRIYLSNPNNTFTGSVFCNGTGLASAAFAASNTVPNYAAVTGHYGRIALMVKNEDSLWQPEDILRFANAAVWENGTYLTLDASESDVKEFTMPGSVWSQVKNAGLRLSPDGDNVLTVTSPLADRWYAFTSVDGTLRFTGDEKIQVGSISAGMLNPDAHAQEAGKILIEDAANFCFTNNMVSLGGAQGDKPTNARRLGEMTIRNSKVTGYVADWKSGADTSGIYAGWYGDGIVTIEDGADVSSKFVVGAGSSDSRGAVYQRGGKVAIQGVASYGKQENGSFIGKQGNGYYEVSGGLLKFVNCIAIGGEASSQGILAILGGTVENKVASAGTGNSITIGNGAGLAHLYIKDGTFSNNSHGYFGLKGGSRVAITLDGPNARFEQSEQTLQLSKAAGGCAINFNLNGGVFASKYINIESAASVSTPGYVYFNFNGGTYKPLANSSNIINTRTDGTGYSYFHVFEGGMTVDTSGIGGYAVISTPLQQATGSGIVSVPLPDAVKNAKLTGSPEVAITGGGGTGAQAYADFDSTTRKVTGVHVICPGWDYETAPTATFKMGSVTLGTSTCAIAANKPGRLIKKGANTLRLNAVNTYTGDTVLEGGTLQATVEGAIPAKTRVVFAGGVMNCGSYTKPTKYAIDLKQVKASGAPVAYNTALSFPVGSTLELIDGGTLSEGDPTKIVLFKMGSGAVLSGTENVTLTGVDTKNWHLAWTGDSLKVVKNLGTIITIR